MPCSRTVHSLALLLARFKGVHLVFVSPPSLALPEYLREELAAKGVPQVRIRTYRMGLMGLAIEKSMPLPFFF